jgi:hypothetical protein
MHRLRTREALTARSLVSGVVQRCRLPGSPSDISAIPRGGLTTLSEWLQVETAVGGIVVDPPKFPGVLRLRADDGRGFSIAS